MKVFLTTLCVLLALGCGAETRPQGAAGAPGGQQRGADASPPAAEKAATNGAYSQIGTNVNTERAANTAITRAATNSPNIGGTVAAPGGTSLGGTGTGEYGAIFWFYVGLDVVFLVWLVLAIRHRVHVRKLASASGSAH